MCFTLSIYSIKTAQCSAEPEMGHLILNFNLTHIIKITLKNLIKNKNIT